VRTILLTLGGAGSNSIIKMQRAGKGSHNCLIIYWKYL